MEKRLINLLSGFVTIDAEKRLTNITSLDKSNTSLDKSNAQLDTTKLTEKLNVSVVSEYEPVEDDVV